MTIWMLGQFLSPSWSIEGVFLTKREAMDAGEVGWFISEIEVGKRIPLLPDDELPIEVLV
jgi:hypothetical protein